MDRCIIHCHICSLCDRTCSEGYCDLLVFIWAGSDPGFDTDRRNGYCHCCSIHCSGFGTENRSYAEKYHAGSDFRPPFGWYCPAYQVYPEDHSADRTDRSSFADADILWKIWDWKRGMVLCFSFCFCILQCRI